MLFCLNSGGVKGGPVVVDVDRSKIKNRLSALDPPTDTEPCVDAPTRGAVYRDGTAEAPAGALQSPAIASTVRSTNTWAPSGPTMLLITVAL